MTRVVSLAVLALGLLAPSLEAASCHPALDVGSPVLSPLWVDPVAGNDAASGATRAQALLTIEEAWSRIPSGAPLAGTGYRILLVAGTYGPSGLPSFWEDRIGTAQFPIQIEAADGDGTAMILGNVDIFGCSYLYWIGVSIDAAGGDAFHFASGDHLLLRRMTIRGEPPSTYAVQEVVKVNQAEDVYIESSDLSGAWDNAIDMVAVQRGHILDSKVHDAGWCLYLKGGSGSFVVDSNEVYDCGESGIAMGQGTGFEFMVSPFLHYEAFSTLVSNNVVHDIVGAGLGAFGGYEILFAYNTLYHVGERSHVLEAVFGSRSCDGDAVTCQSYLSAGGWGTAVTGGAESAPIPNRHVHFVANVVANPSPYQSMWQQLEVPGPQTPPAASNVPDPAHADDDLVFLGNVIWNGPPDHPVGFGEGTGCDDLNPTCNEARVLADNAINTLEPTFVDAGSGDFRLIPGSPLALLASPAFPGFPGDDLPGPPTPPPGGVAFDVPCDRDGQARAVAGPPGAYTASGLLFADGFESGDTSRWTVP